MNVVCGVGYTPGQVQYSLEQQQKEEATVELPARSAGSPGSPVGGSP